MIVNFVFEIAPRIFDRLVAFIFSVVLLIFDFRVVLLATVLLVVLLGSNLFSTKVGFFIIIGRFGNCSLFVVLFGMDASDVPPTDDLSVVLLATDFSVRLFIIDPLVVLFSIDFSIVLFITLINNGGLSVMPFVARLSVVITNGCGSSIQLLFVMTFSLEVSTVLFATDFGVITAIGSILAVDCVCSSKILVILSG